MNRNTLRTSLLAFALLLSSGAARADGEPIDPELVCGTSDADIYLEGAAATTATLDALMICVTFPNIAPDNGIPSWLPGMAGEGVEGTFEAYMRIVSENRLLLNIHFERRPPPFQDEAFMALHPDTYYRDVGIGVLNAEIFAQIAANHGGTAYLDGFERFFFVYNGDPFADNIGGIATTGVSGRIGYSARLLFPGSAIDGTQNRIHSEWVAVHEYGHLMGLGHVPQTGIDSECFKKLGRYSPMQSEVPRGEERGYHVYDLPTLIKLGWFDRVAEIPRVPGQSYAVTLQDVRRGGAAIKVPIVSWFGVVEEYLLIANHQHSDYDATYPGTGLLIWHIRRDLTSSNIGFWDLEVASGMFDGNVADPIDGRDSLDVDGLARAGDFWQSGNFDGASNPNTSRYQPVNCPVQKSASGIAIQNIVQGASEVSFQLEFTAAPPLVDAVIAVPAQSFIGLDCAAAHVYSVPLTAAVQDHDGVLSVGVPKSWMSFELQSRTPASLVFCGGTSRHASGDTDASGMTSSRFYHACGGGKYDVSLTILGEPVGTSAIARLRTPDLSRDGRVDIIDIGLWVQPYAGPPEDDIRDLNFDLLVNVVDLGRLAGQLNTELEGDVHVEMTSPLEGAQLPAGSTATLSASVCTTDGSSPTIQFQRTNGMTFQILGPGPSLDWLVVPPLETTTLKAVASVDGIGGSDDVSVVIRAPNVDIGFLGTTPATLPIGASGTVRFRLTNQEAVALSSLRGILSFPNGDLTVISGPVPANPHALAAGGSVDLEWVVRRVSGSGPSQAVVQVKLQNNNLVLVSESFSVF